MKPENFGTNRSQNVVAPDIRNSDSLFGKMASGFSLLAQFLQKKFRDPAPDLTGSIASMGKFKENQIIGRKIEIAAERRRLGLSVLSDADLTDLASKQF